MSRPAADRRDLEQLLDQLQRIQDTYAGRRMPEEVGRDFEKRAKEAEKLQRELEGDK